jgi:hypothetical protein
MSCLAVLYPWPPMSYGLSDDRQFLHPEVQRKKGIITVERQSRILLEKTCNFRSARTTYVANYKKFFSIPARKSYRALSNTTIFLV